MQATVTTTTPTAAPSAPPAPPPITVTFTDVDGTTQNLVVPLTQQAVDNIKAERRELSRQLNSAADRRDQLSEEIKSAPAGASRAGLEQRIAVLDKRIVQLESDIAATGRQLSAAPQALTASTEVPVGSNDIPDNVMGLSITFILFVIAPIAFSLARWVPPRCGKVSVPSSV